MSVLPLLDNVVCGLRTSQVLVAVLDFRGVLVRKPVGTDQIYILVAKLPQTEKKEVVIYKAEFTAIVSGSELLKVLLMAG